MIEGARFGKWIGEPIHMNPVGLFGAQRDPHTHIKMRVGQSERLARKARAWQRVFPNMRGLNDFGGLQRVFPNMHGLNDFGGLQRAFPNIHASMILDD
jgi:hypothetical protein